MGSCASANRDFQTQDQEICESKRSVSRALPRDDSMRSMKAFVRSPSSGMTPSLRPPSPSEAYPGDLEPLWKQPFTDEDLSKLLAQGHPYERAVQALELAKGDLEFARAVLRDDARLDAAAGRGKRQPRADPSDQVPSQFHPLPTEADYDVSFPPPKFGFEIKPGASNGQNAIVTKRFSDISKDVMPDSMIVAVGGKCVVRTRFDEIRQIMAQSMKAGEAVKVRFRGKRKRLQRFWQQGTLVMMVMGAQELQQKATHCAIRVNHATLVTDPVASSRNPIWNSTVKFNNIYSGRVRKGTLTIFQNRTVGGSKAIASGTFAIPLRFDEIQDIIVDLKDKKGNLVGLVPAKILVRSR